MVSFWVLNYLSRGLVLYGLCLMLALTLSALLNGLFSHKRNELKPRSSRFILLEPFYILKSRLVACSFLIRGPSIIQTTHEKVHDGEGEQKIPVYTKYSANSGPSRMVRRSL